MEKTIASLQAFLSFLPRAPTRSRASKFFLPLPLPQASGYEARRVQHFPDFNLERIFITKNIFIMKNPTDFVERVETGVDPCLPNSRLGESPTTSHCQVECWHV